MSKCLKCKKEITHLLRCEMANVVSAMYLDETGEVRLKEQSFEPEAVEFLCPECNEKLFDSSEDAENFLKGISLIGEKRPNHSTPSTRMIGLNFLHYPEPKSLGTGRDFKSSKGR